MKRLPHDSRAAPTPATRSRSRFLGAVALLGAMATVPAQATDLPWLPPRGSATLSIEATEATAATFLLEAEPLELDFGEIDWQVQSARLTYAIGHDWAIDGSFGEVAAEAPLLGQSIGSADYDIGLIWRPVNEQASPGAPSVAVRFGWIGAGDYDAERVHAPGAGETGYGATLAIGKVFREALSFSATLGGRFHAEPIPSVMSVGVTAALLSQPATLERILGGMEGGVIFRASYRTEISTGDKNLADLYEPSPAAPELPELAREFSRAGLGVAVAAGPMEIAAEAFRYLDGRNVGSFEGVTVRLTLKADLLTLLRVL